MEAIRVGSPFDQIIAHWHHPLAEPLARLFLHGDATSDVLLVGAMDRVWRRHRWLNPALGTLARQRLLFPEAGRDVPATLRVHVLRDPGGNPRQVWGRRFRFAVVRAFDAELSYDSGRNVIVERLGRTGRLEITWRMESVEPDGLAISAAGGWIRIAGRAVPLPAILTPRAVAVQRGVGRDAIAVEVTIGLPVLGPIIGYSGVFRVTTTVPIPTATRLGPTARRTKRSEAASGWLRAAAIYNVIWGGLAMIAPHRLTRLLGLGETLDPTGWRAAGVTVAAFAPAYWWAASNPVRARPLVGTAVLGKAVGLASCLAGIATGRVPRAALLMVLFNDAVWLPAFGLFAMDRPDAETT
jgi:hypothetical protein